MTTTPKRPPTYDERLETLMNSTSAPAGDTALRARLLKALPWLWLGMSAAWAVVIFTTDQLAWPLALWIATTVGPLIALKTHIDPKTGPSGDLASTYLDTNPTESNDQ